jgi:hypothetical protein
MRDGGRGRDGSVSQGKPSSDRIGRSTLCVPARKAHPYADQNLSFPGVAAKLGLGRYWSGGSKLPAISHLLTATLETERGRFRPLVLAVVQQGMVYRRNKDPVSREDIQTLAGCGHARKVAIGLCIV